MKFPTLSTLACATTCLWFAACSPAPDADEELVGGLSGGQSAESNEPNGTDEASEPNGALANNPLANRLRLPDMTGLPTDKELASKEKPDKSGGGVSVRPPSE